MSPGVKKPGIPTKSFPRVSGDEPGSLVGFGMGPKFSPREWG